nr:SJCHGC04710 protein [Schistosoma japonicum]
MAVNNEKPKRDAWMTELLPKTNDLNSLKPRKFRQDLSIHSHHDPSWFTAPINSEDHSVRHASNSQINQSTTDNLRSQRNEIYDHNMAKIASKYQSSKQKSSLLELHEKKLKKHKLKKHKEKSKKHKSKKHKKGHRSSSSSSSSSSPSEPTRRPFDRDKDLKISRIDTAARKAIIEHSKKLTSRFSHGSQQYL